MEPKTVDLPGDQLLVTLQAGDITAFEMIFKTYYQPLCNYAYSFVHDRDEAEGAPRRDRRLLCVRAS